MACNAAFIWYLSLQHGVTLATSSYQQHHNDEKAKARENSIGESSIKRIGDKAW